MNKKLIKHIIFIIAALTLSASLFGGCSEQDGRPSVYASFYVTAHLAELIGGADVRIETLASGDPHDFELTPKQRAGMERAALVLYAGGGFEAFMTDSLIADLQKGGAALFDASAAEGVTLIAGDPHLWLSPLNFKAMLFGTARAFAAALPESAELYQQRAEAAAADIDALHDEYAAALAPFAGETVFVMHEAFGYLCTAYGLSQRALTGLHEEEPSAAARAAFTDALTAAPYRTLFAGDAGELPRAASLAAGCNGTAALLLTLESGADNGYAAAMRANLAALKANFGV